MRQKGTRGQDLNLQANTAPVTRSMKLVCNRTSVPVEREICYEKWCLLIYLYTPLLSSPSQPAGIRIPPEEAKAAADHCPSSLCPRISTGLEQTEQVLRVNLQTKQTIPIPPVLESEILEKLLHPCHSIGFCELWLLCILQVSF